MGKKVLLATEKPFAGQAVHSITDIFANSGYSLIKLEKYSNKSELLEAVKDVEALIIRSDKIDKEVLEAAENLKIVVRGGAGYDNVDCSTATERGVCVMNTPGQNANAVAELAIGMMVMLARKNYCGQAGTELRDKKLGIHAYGNIGRFVAKIAKGFGMDVYAFDPFVNKEKMEEDGVWGVDTMDELYSTCNYVSLHLPKIEETLCLVNYNLLSKMPKGATLINTARKEVVCEEGLLKVLEERDDFKYASDIAPSCKDKITEKFDGRYFFTPKKMGAQTLEANVNAGIAAAKQIVNFFVNNDRTFQVNK